jgi:hypothetical protein
MQHRSRHSRLRMLLRSIPAIASHPCRRNIGARTHRRRAPTRLKAMALAQELPALSSVIQLEAPAPLIRSACSAMCRSFDLIARGLLRASSAEIRSACCLCRVSISSIGRRRGEVARGPSVAVSSCQPRRSFHICGTPLVPIGGLPPHGTLRRDRQDPEGSRRDRERGYHLRA